MEYPQGTRTPSFDVEYFSGLFANPSTLLIKDSLLAYMAFFLIVYID